MLCYAKIPSSTHTHTTSFKNALHGKKINGPIQGLTYRNSLSSILSNVNMDKFTCIACCCFTFNHIINTQCLMMIMLNICTLLLGWSVVVLYCDLCCNNIINDVRNVRRQIFKFVSITASRVSIKMYLLMP